MSPEAKAREIVQSMRDHPETQLYDPTDVMEPIIVQALRDVERETLERAAQVAENFAVPSVHDDCATAIDDASDAIAQSIRSLLQKEGG